MNGLNTISFHVCQYILYYNILVVLVHSSSHIQHLKLFHVSHTFYEKNSAWVLEYTSKPYMYIWKEGGGDWLEKEVRKKEILSVFF